MFKPYKNEAKPNAAECAGAIGAVQDALYVLNGKWKLPIIIALSEGNKRFGELQRAVPGIAPKVLSAELKMLELNGFVVRHVYDSIPVSVEYELLEYANSLGKVIESLKEWGTQHRNKLRSEAKKAKKNGSLKLEV